MGKYTKVGWALWGKARVTLLAALMAAGCASAPKSDTSSTPAYRPPPPASTWTPSNEPVAVRDDAPLTYVVKKGDTLWDIASHFLLDPWQWPEIWVVNDQIRNPHLIYPGDTLKLVWVNGRPGVSLSGDLNKLSPRIRESSLDAAIPTIPLDAIRDFLSAPRLITLEDVEHAPYIVDFVDPHILGGANFEIFVKNLVFGGLPRYAAVRLGERYVDPDTHSQLGWEAIPVGDVEVKELGGEGGLPGVALLTRTVREARTGDFLIKPEPELYNANFYPHAPRQAINGRIISVYDGVSQIGQYDVITLSKGAEDGVEVGHVLSIMQSGRVARDPVAKRNQALPDTYAGLVLVFKVESRVSYALVMKATREVHVLDRVVRPKPTTGRLFGRAVDREKSWLALVRADGIGPVAVAALLARFGTAEHVFAAAPAQWREAGLTAAQVDALAAPDTKGIAADLAWLADRAAGPRGLLTLEDSAYPERLREIPQPPPALFWQGDPAALRLAQVGIVGARSATPQGLENARAFAAELGRRGLAITSGLALGVDGAAHRGALESGSPTIAVCGTGLDRVYPARHRELAHAIAAQGVLISEFPTGVGAQAENFPRRNRIISGLALGVLVVEAALESGSLITARYAMEQGREVFAIPGSIHNAMARGCHYLIRQGAKLVESADDVIEELAPQLGTALRTSTDGPAAAAPFEPLELRVLEALGDAPMPVDALVERMDMDIGIAQLQTVLLALELRGAVASAPGGTYQRIR